MESSVKWYDYSPYGTAADICLFVCGQVQALSATQGGFFYWAGLPFWEYRGGSVTVAAGPGRNTCHTGLAGMLLFWRFVSALCPSNAHTYARRMTRGRCSMPHTARHPETHSPRSTNITLRDISRGVALPLNVPDPWRECLLLTSCLFKSSPRLSLLVRSLPLASPCLNKGFAYEARRTLLEHCVKMSMCVTKDTHV